jgi:hypothetical protein
MFIEAVCLYDRVVVFDPHPYHDPAEFFPKAQIRNHPWIEAMDLYPTVEERLKATMWFGYKTDLPTGRVTDAEFLDYPQEFYFSNKKILTEFPEKIMVAAMSTMGTWKGQPFWKCATEEYTRNFQIQFATSRMWQIESARSVRESVGADGLFLPPDMFPFWAEERRRLQSSLHTKMDEAQKIILRQITPDSDVPLLDVGALTHIALDSTVEREGMWETILQMRMDYAELRDIGRTFSTSLAEAEHNQDIADVLVRWRDAWDKILQSLAKPPQSLIHRLFGWDVIKKGTLRGIFFEAADTVGKHWKDIQVQKGLTLVRELQSEVFFARPFASRIESLFGGSVFS